MNTQQKNIDWDIIRSGDKVTVRAGSPQHDGNYTVVKVNPRNVKLQREGSDRLLNCPKDYIFPYDADGTTVHAAFENAPLPQPNVVLGSVVKFPVGTMGKMPTGPHHAYVVVAIRGDMFNVALLGGDGNRYWHIRPNGYQHVQILDRSEVAA